ILCAPAVASADDSSPTGAASPPISAPHPASNTDTAKARKTGTFIATLPCLENGASLHRARELAFVARRIGRTDLSGANGGTGSNWPENNAKGWPYRFDVEAVLAVAVHVGVHRRRQVRDRIGPSSLDPQQAIVDHQPRRGLPQTDIPLG